MNEKLEVTLLYVEDEVTTRKTICGMLRRRVHAVHEAGDGREGLVLFREHDPDIVITDSRMPAMDGIEMSIAMKALKPGIPIVFTSAYEEPEFMEQLERIGITSRFVKPIDVKELWIALEAICAELKSPAAGNAACPTRENGFGSRETPQGGGSP
jgi:YesN/AraC family two-component response regulator